MPPRSTPFQKLVLHIQEQLAQGASVTESAMLRHRGTGSEREVDIVVRATVGEHTVVIAIECIEQGRPADQTWVEQMWAKHQKLETDKLVLVSLNGFSNPALLMAKDFKIDAYTPTQACEADWTEVVGLTELFVFRYDFTPDQMWLRFNTAQGLIGHSAGGDTRISIPQRDAECSLSELVSESVHHANFALPAMESFNHDGKAKMECSFHIGEPFLALTEGGAWVPVAEIALTLVVHRHTSPIQMRSLGWNGTPAAFGSGPTVVGDTVLTVVEKEPGKIDARIIIDGKRILIHRREPAM